MSDLPERKKNVPNPLFANLRVLVVEDNPVDKELLFTYLEEFGFCNVQSAHDGGSALFKIENALKIEKPFQLIVSDWRMPGQDGLTLLKRVRSLKEIQEIGIIMVTSVADQGKVREALRQGVDDFVVKPVNIDVLREKVTKLVTRLNKSK